ncbi:MAG: hypothetical protein J6B51_05760, partial [Clostridia bacterium]|nr:hypothetical protein [Clostridia bacterium]
QILYNSQTLPVYTYMVPEGEYPTLPNTNKSKYKNCICSLHGFDGAHYYTYKFSFDSSDEETYENATIPAALISPKELETKLNHEKDIELSRQIFNITGGKIIIQGTTLFELYPDLFDENGNRRYADPALYPFYATEEATPETPAQ